MDVSADLLSFARDQIKTIGAWQGIAYVKRCLVLWADEYGEAVAQAVRAELRADFVKGGR